MKALIRPEFHPGIGSRSDYRRSVKYGLHDAFHAGASPIPFADNTQSLGTAANRFAEVYVASGVISSSDAGQKSDISGLPEALRAVGAAPRKDLGVFRWNTAKEDKGEAVRWHIGLTAQQVALRFQENGLDPEEDRIFAEI